MSERETQRQGERVGGWSEALAASRWFGAFCIAVSIQAWARSWHVVRKQLGLEKKTKQSWRFTFCFKHGVLLVVPSVISTDWFCPDMHVNTVIREGSKNSLLMCLWVKIAFLFKLNLHLSLGRKCIENVSGQQLSLGSGSSSLYVVTK